MFYSTFNQYISEPDFYLHNFNNFICMDSYVLPEMPNKKKIFNLDA